MGHPKGMRAWARPLDAGAHVHIYSDDKQIILQLRRAVPTEDDMLAPSFKVAVTLTPTDALALAAELLGAASKALDAHTSSMTATGVEVIETGETRAIHVAHGAGAPTQPDEQPDG